VNPGPVGDDAVMTLIDEYLARTPGSAALFERATASIPGGSTRTTIFNPPYPPYMVRGEGLRTWDVDGNEYRDFLGNYTSLILGHTHPDVVAAVEAQVRRGSAFAAPTEVEIELAEEIRGRLPSVERIRFTNSGTEATMFAIRAARAFTGRPLLAKFERAYHGTHDTALAATPGVPDGISNLVVELPWDDADGVERGLAGRERDVAAIIIEPVQGGGGVRAAGPAFLRFLRDYADRIGALLIFDEIIAFRIGPNGAQGVFGVRPDLTTLGKIVGGGFPLAAFGGRADVMDRFDARRPGSLSHGGTFNGNPVGAAAGLATLRFLTAERYERLASLGERARKRIGAGIAARELDARVDGIASLFQVFAGPSLQGEGDLSPAATLFLGLLVDGFHLAPRGMGAISTPVTDADADALADAVVERLGSMQPAAVPVS
jgi:glutamate-1-semialdehyde 2,1-aminomutase